MKLWGNRHSPGWLVGMQSARSLIERGLATSNKSIHSFTSDPAIILLRNHSEKNTSPTTQCIHVKVTDCGIVYTCKNAETV